jgi:hypothetical protein
MTQLIRDLLDTFFRESNAFIDYTDNLFVGIKSYTDVLYYPISTVAVATHRDEQQIFLLFGFLTAILAGLVISVNKDVTQRKIMSTVMGIFIGFYFMGVRFALCAVYQMVAYVSMLIFPRNVQHHVTISFGVIITLILHVYLYMIRDNSFGLSSHIMSSFVRQYCISLNYKDGGEDPKKLTSREQQFALKKIPAFWDYFSYMFYLSSVLVGPFVEYKTFIDWANLSGHFKDMPTLGQIPMLARRMGAFAFTVITVMVLDQFVSFDYMLTPEFAS